MKEFPPFQLDTVTSAYGSGAMPGKTNASCYRQSLYAVLCHLVEHAGGLVTQDELLQALLADPERLRSSDLTARVSWPEPHCFLVFQVGHLLGRA